MGASAKDPGFGGGLGTAPGLKDAPVERIGDRYAVYGEIASGGMAAVHYAQLLGPVGFNRTVAIKRLHANLRAQPDFVRMFVDEARLAARVRHPNVVATIDVVDADDQICLVMEYVHGESLRRLARRAMAQGGRIPRRIAAAIMVGALHGLHAAHEAKNERGEPLGLVHRDVSPHNILVGADGIPRVIDFGIAKARGQLRDSSGSIKGKFAYMAPEQLTASEVSRAADIYAASVVLWELLTGRRLFDSKMDASLLERANVKIQKPSSIVPSLTPALDGVVLKGLSGDPALRFSSARAMARAIEDCIAPASNADVGEWVERMAKDRLELRENALAEIEGRPAKMNAERLTVPDGAKRSLAPVSIMPPSLYATDTPSASADVLVPLDGRKARDDSDPPAGAAEDGLAELGAEIPMEEAPPTEPVLTVMDAARPAGAHPYSGGAPSAPKPGGRLAWVLLVLFVALASTAMLAGPGLARRRVTSAASARGFLLDSEQVFLRGFSGALLTGNRIEPRQLAGVTLAIGDLEVGSGNGAVNVQGFDARLQGGLDATSADLERWADAQASPMSVDARSGHVLWSDAFGKNTALESWDTAVTVGSGKVTVSSPNVILRVPRARFGPFGLRYEGAGAGSRLELSLDPADPKLALVVTWGPAQGSATLDISRAPLARLGIPAAAFGIFGDVEVAVRASVLSTPGGKPQGQFDLALYGLHADRAGPNAFDARLTGRLAGAALSSLAISDAQLVTGQNKTLLSGGITVKDAWAHVELTPKGGDSGLVSGAISFDTRDLTGR